MQSFYADNNGIRIHALVSQQSKASPLVFIPGMLGEAEDWTKEIQDFSPERRCLAISLRGRGKSDAPPSGYSLQDHVSDIRSVFETLNLSGATLVAHSAGVAYALGFASSRPDLIKALVLLDYPPFYLPIEPSWAERYAASPPREALRAETIWALQRESGFHDFQESLSQFRFPVAYVCGGQKASMLSREDLAEFEKLLTQPFIHVEEESDHEMRTLNLRTLLRQLPGQGQA